MKTLNLIKGTAVVLLGVMVLSGCSKNNLSKEPVKKEETSYAKKIKAFDKWVEKENSNLNKKSAEQESKYFKEKREKYNTLLKDYVEDEVLKEGYYLNTEDYMVYNKKTKELNLKDLPQDVVKKDYMKSTEKYKLKEDDLLNTYDNLTEELKNTTEYKVENIVKKEGKEGYYYEISNGTHTINYVENTLYKEIGDTVNILETEVVGVSYNNFDSSKLLLRDDDLVGNLSIYNDTDRVKKDLGTKKAYIELEMTEELIKDIQKSKDKEEEPFENEYLKQDSRTYISSYSKTGSSNEIWIHPKEIISWKILEIKE